MGSMIPCYNCFSDDGVIDYGDFTPCSYPCCNCDSKKYKQCNPEICKTLDKKCEKIMVD